MTSFAAIADQSDAALWPTWVLIVVAIPIIAAVASVLSLAFRPHGVPVMGDELSLLDLADRPRCRMAHCARRGTVRRTTFADIGLETVWVCPGCSDEGTLKGWWVQ